MLKKIIITLYFLNVCFITSLLAQGVPTTRLSVKVNNPKENRIAFLRQVNFLDEVEEKNNFYFTNGNSFSQSWIAPDPFVVAILYNDRKFNVFLEPGDNLQITFEGDNFPLSMSFQGKGAEHNAFLRRFEENNQLVNERVVTNKLNELNFIEFKEWINNTLQKKLTFIKEYDAVLYKNFSPFFKNYLQGETYYWRAGQLLRYRSESEGLVSYGSSNEIDNYHFDFLNQIIVNNDMMLMSENYRKFLFFYHKYRLDNPASPYGLPASQVWIKVKEEIDFYESTYTGASAVGKFSPNEQLLVVDKLTYGGQYTMAVAYRLKVRSMDGREGWIKTFGIELIPEAIFNRNTVAVEDYTQKQSKIAELLKVNWSSVEVHTEPYETGVTATCFLGDELIYLNQKTDQAYPYKIDSFSTVSDIFYKVRTKGGNVGWVIKQAVTLFEKEYEQVTNKSRITTNSSTPMNNLDFFFTGKILSYMLGKDIKNKLRTTQNDAVKPTMDVFMSITRDVRLRNEMSSIYANAYSQQREATKMVNESITNTRTVQINIPPIRFRFDEKSSIPSAKPVENNTTTTIISATANGKTLNVSPTMSDIANVPNVTTNTTASSNIATKPNVEEKNNTLINNLLSEKKINNFGLVRSNLRGNMTATGYFSPKFYALSDYISGQEKLYNIALDDNSNFKNSLLLYEPLVGEMVCGSDSTAIWLAPGDSLNISTNGYGANRTMSCTGKNASPILFLNALRQYSKTIEVNLRSKIKTEENPDAFLAFLDNSLQAKYSFLRQYPQSGTFSKDFLDYIKAEIDYWYAFNVLNYPIEHPLLNAVKHSMPKQFSVNDNYYNALNKIAIQNDAVLSSRYYRFFLDEYIKYLSRTPKHRGRFQSAIAEEIFNGKTGNYLKAKFLVQKINNNVSEGVLQEAYAFINASVYPLHAEAVKNAVNKNLPNKRGIKAPDFRLTNAKGEVIALSDCIGKVVHIDFWATWCGPCINNMKRTEQMREQFSEENVLFLYVNTEKDRQKWLDFVEERRMDKNRHLWDSSENPYTVEAVDAYKVAHLPTTILINKRGEIEVDSSTRLNDAAVLTEIRRLVK
jgi:peroxiredoxin